MYVDFEAEALAFAYKCHDGQTRKNSDVPYIIHPVRVGLILRIAHIEVPGFFTRPSMVIAGGFLHDTIEDCGLNGADFQEEFGYDTGNSLYDLVKEVSDVSVPEDGNRAKRKALDREHLARSSSEGASIKLADVIDNAADIKTLQPSFVAVYREEMQALVPRLAHGHPTLYVRACEAVGL
jgi:(p)ppGpp synthase/HD superfamily hydrolase